MEKTIELLLKCIIDEMIVSQYQKLKELNGSEHSKVSQWFVLQPHSKNYVGSLPSAQCMIRYGSVSQDP